MARIALSVAHNPAKPGACSSAGTCEYELSMGWTGACAMRLVQLEHDPEIITTYSLKEKVTTVNSLSAACALEIHFNSNVDADGAETLYCPGSKAGKSLAEVVQIAMTDKLFVKNRGVKEGWYRMEPPHVNPNAKPDYFLKYTNCPAIIVEPEFMSNVAWIERNSHKGGVVIAEAIDLWIRGK